MDIPDLLDLDSFAKKEKQGTEGKFANSPRVGD